MGVVTKSSVVSFLEQQKFVNITEYWLVLNKASLGKKMIKRLYFKQFKQKEHHTHYLVIIIGINSMLDQKPFLFIS